MDHPFTRFDFQFKDYRVAADYEDIDGVLHFTFTMNERVEFSAQFSQFHLDSFIEIDRLHYGDVIESETRPTSAFKGTGLPAACIDQVLRKHPELRFVIRSGGANEAALKFATDFSRTHLLFFVF